MRSAKCGSRGETRSIAEAARQAAKAASPRRKASCVRGQYKMFSPPPSWTVDQQRQRTVVLNRVGALGHGSERHRAPTRAVLEVRHVLAHHFQHRPRFLSRHPQSLERLGRRGILSCWRPDRGYRCVLASIHVSGLPIGGDARHHWEPVSQQRVGSGVLPPQHSRCRNVCWSRRRQDVQADRGTHHEQAHAANGEGNEQTAD